MSLKPQFREQWNGCWWALLVSIGEERRSTPIHRRQWKSRINNIISKSLSSFHSPLRVAFDQWFAHMYCYSDNSNWGSSLCGCDESFFCMRKSHFEKRMSIFNWYTICFYPHTESIELDSLRWRMWCFSVTLLPKMCIRRRQEPFCAIFFVESFAIDKRTR